MNQPHLSPEQLAKLEEIYEFAQGTEKKLHELDKLSAAIAQKWEQHKVNQFPLGWNEHMKIKMKMRQ